MNAADAAASRISSLDGVAPWPAVLERRTDRVEIDRVLQIEADRMVGRIALEIDQRVIARIAAHGDLVAAEIGGSCLRAPISCRPMISVAIADRAVEIGVAEAGDSGYPAD